MLTQTEVWLTPRFANVYAHQPGVGGKACIKKDFDNFLTLSEIRFIPQNIHDFSVQHGANKPTIKND
jgi:hypothetical protein